MARAVAKSNPVLEHLDEAFGTIIECAPRKRALRVSSLPYCPILDLANPRDEPERADLPGVLYTSIGSSVHTGIQTYMPLSKRFGRCVWGSWKCPKCLTVYKDQFRPKDFCCDVPYEYIEVDFQIGPMSGHLDMLCKYGNLWIAYEFKTTGRAPSAPKPGYLLQIRTYCEMLRLKYGIRVHSYVVVYIGREHFKRTVFGPYSNTKSSQKTADWLFRAIRGYKAVTQAKKNPTRENLAAVVENRPCKCEASYQEYMARSFTISKGCPLLATCKRGNAAVERALRDVTGYDHEAANAEVAAKRDTPQRRSAKGARDRPEHVRDRPAERHSRAPRRPENHQSRVEHRHDNKRAREARSSTPRARVSSRALPRKVL